MSRLRTALLAIAAPLVLVSPSAAQEPSSPIFAVRCDFSHRAPDDPIVAPGQPGGSHDHDFLGNTSTNAFSTHESLRAAGTRCRRPADTAAYWVPTLYSGGQAIQPAQANIYYSAAGKPRDAVEAHPAGLRIVAGDARATAPQSARVVSWHCGAGSGVNAQATVPTCPAPHQLRVRVRFPDCWDGTNLDSADHKSHLAYARRGMCPAMHPVPLPSVALNVRYPIAGGPDVTLSSGPPHTAHGDFFNAWDQAELERLVELCINGSGSPDRRACARQVAAPPPAAVRQAPRLFANQSRVRHGAGLVLSGTAGDAQGVPVRLDVERSGRWSALAEVTTGMGGSFRHFLTAGQNARYRAVDSIGMSSEPLAVWVAPRIAVALRRAGAAIRVRARVTPRKRKLVLRVQRRAGDGWRAVRARRMSMRGRRGRARVALRPGRYRLTVGSPADSLHVAGLSRPLHVRVR
jgi:hypothetical protein